MIMATGTVHRYPHDASGNHIDSIINHFIASSDSRAKGEKAECSEVSMTSSSLWVIGSYLFDNEFVVGFILVQRVNDPVPIGVGIDVAG